MGCYGLNILLLHHIFSRSVGYRKHTNNLRRICRALRTSVLIPLFDSDVTIPEGAAIPGSSHFIGFVSFCLLLTQIARQILKRLLKLMTTLLPFAIAIYSFKLPEAIFSKRALALVSLCFMRATFSLPALPVALSELAPSA